MKKYYADNVVRNIHYTKVVVKTMEDKCHNLSVKLTLKFICNKRKKTHDLSIVRVMQSRGFRGIFVCSSILVGEFFGVT